MSRNWIAAFLTVALTGAFAPPVRAGYYWGGNGMAVVSSGTVANGAIYMQSVSPWPSYGNVSGGYSFQFTGTPASDSIVSSRLLVAVYGGTKDYTATLTATINGNATIVNFGGGGDGNPEFTAAQTNVYGSTSSGAWVISIPVAAANLNSGGTADNVNITITNDPNFDGRIVYSSLWEVYQKASLNNSFQYAVAEGSGDIYSTTPGTAQTPTVPSRLVDMGGFNLANLQTAKLDTLYTYVHNPQDNHLYLNGSLVGGDPAVSSGSTYAAVQASFDVTSGLSSSDNQVKFSVDPADGVTSSGTSVFRPQEAIIEATYNTPEPATLCLLAVGGMALLRRTRPKAWCNRGKNMRLPLACLLAAAVMSAVAVTSSADVFNMAAGQTSLGLVPVGNAGNAADPLTGLGAVPYAYSIGTFDVTAAQYTAFLNAVAATDTYGLYNSNMADGYAACGITQSGSSGSCTYTTTGNPNYPVNYVTFADALRFCNWLTNNQPTGGENLSTTESGSYYINSATTDAQLDAVTRQAGARFVLPSVNEWYKAAYYNAPTGTYWLYPTKSNTAPVAEAPSGSGGSSGSANYNGTGLTAVGAYTSSPGPYGTFDQGGLVFQWTDTPMPDEGWGAGFAMVNSSFESSSDELQSTNPLYPWTPDSWDAYEFSGFRVAEVPEPATLCLLAVGAFGLIRKRRRHE